MPEYKQLAYATKAITDRTVIGIACVHGNIDDGGDRSWPGSFADTRSTGAIARALPLDARCNESANRQY